MIKHNRDRPRRGAVEGVRAWFLSSLRVLLRLSVSGSVAPPQWSCSFRIILEDWKNIIVTQNSPNLMLRSVSFSTCCVSDPTLSALRSTFSLFTRSGMEACFCSIMPSRQAAEEGGGS